MTYEEEIEKEPFAPEVEAALREAAVGRAPGKLAKLACAQSEDEVFAHLPGAAAAAFHLGQFADAKLHAERALTLAPGYRNNWNYGNALHLGHTVLGLLALSEGDVSRAIVELHASACTEGSPQLNSFGPTMQLAKALLREGQGVPVFEYLERCRVFWEMGGAWLDSWERKIQAGQVPNFFQHSYA
ncbi:hypothetical protein SNK19_14200 [Ralstonia pseudosolanacearum]|uniref:hypothetical protein n=1 Tax=Ralstonia pseudosolanacearum TaxID=1310165 RepID=UPI003CF39C06